MQYNDPYFLIFFYSVPESQPDGQTIRKVGHHFLVHTNWRTEQEQSGNLEFSKSQHKPIQNPHKDGALQASHHFGSVFF